MQYLEKKKYRVLIYDLYRGMDTFRGGNSGNFTSLLQRGLFQNEKNIPHRSKFFSFNVVYFSKAAWYAGIPLYKMANAI